MLTLLVIGAAILFCDLGWVIRYSRRNKDQDKDVATKGWKPSGESLALLVVNVLFVVGLGAGVVSNSVETPEQRGPDPAKAGPVDDEQVRDPRQHLPLAGMDGFEGDAQEACDRLQGFMFNMNEALVRAQRVPPLMQPDIQELAKKTRCTIVEPDVQQALLRFAKAYEEAKLPTLPPFSLLGSTPLNPDDVLTEKGKPFEEPANGNQGDRCTALGDLVTDMRDELAAAGSASPLSEAQESALLSGSCIMEDTAVQVGMHLYMSAYERAGLTPNPTLLAMTNSR